MSFRFQVAVRNRMTRSIMSTAAGTPHAALGLPAYVQFTSPIRRYTDLLAHYQVLLVNHSDYFQQSVSENSSVCPSQPPQGWRDVILLLLLSCAAMAAVSHVAVLRSVVTLMLI